MLTTGFRRSRKGAWIEMLMLSINSQSVVCRSRKGAWIEILITGQFRSTYKVAPVRERGLKFGSAAGAFTGGIVAPVRERGLKSLLMVL